MGIFHKITGALGGSQTGSGGDVNLDDIMLAAEAPDAPEQTGADSGADSYVKPISLKNDSDIQAVVDELKGKNIVLLNVSAYSRNPAKLKEAVAKLRTFVTGLNGDIARIDDEKILLTPGAVKIVKKRR